MKKSQPHGRRFSRRQEVEFRLDDPNDRAALDEYTRQWVHDIKKCADPAQIAAYLKAKKSGASMAELRVVWMEEAAKAFLRKCQLPDVTPVYFKAEFPRKWSSRPTKSKIGASLDSFVTQHLDFAHDSQEGIAARIIVTAHRFKTEPQSYRECQALDLGELWMLAKAYGIDGSQKSTAGRKPKRRAWADLLADYLVDDCPSASAAQHWQAIPSDSEDPLKIDGDSEDYEFYLDGTKVVCKGSISGEHALAKSTFIKNYLRSAISRAVTTLLS